MKGILMTPDNHRAIRVGRKKQTRRLLKPQPASNWDITEPIKNQEGNIISWCFYQSSDPDFHAYLKNKPRYQVGDIVYIKEAWATMAIFDDLRPSELDVNTPIWVKDTDLDAPTNCGDDMGRWSSPLFTPAWAARDFIKITGIKIERLQNISWADCLAEGIYQLGERDIFFCAETPKLSYSVPQGAFAQLWDSINPKQKWDTNPFVWKIVFEYVTQQESEFQYDGGEKETRQSLAMGNGKTFPNADEAIKWLQARGKDATK